MHELIFTRRIVRLADMPEPERALLAKAILQLKMNGVQLIGLVGSYSKGTWRNASTTSSTLTIIEPYRTKDSVSDIDLVIWPFVPLAIPGVDLHTIDSLPTNIILWPMASFDFAKLSLNEKASAKAAYAKKDFVTLKSIYAAAKVITCGSCVDDFTVEAWTSYALNNNLI